MKVLNFIVFLFLIINSVSAQVGINTVLPLSTLDINGNLSVKVMTVNGGPSGAATLISNGVYISLNPNAGSQEFYVVEPSLVPGRIYILRNINDTNTALLYTAGGKRFFPKNSTTGTAPNGPLIMNANSPNQTLILISDGLNWTYFN